MSNPLSLFQQIQADNAQIVSLHADVMTSERALVAALDPNLTYVVLNADGSATVFDFDEDGNLGCCPAVLLTAPVAPAVVPVPDPTPEVVAPVEPVPDPEPTQEPAAPEVAPAPDPVVVPVPDPVVVPAPDPVVAPAVEPAVTPDPVPAPVVDPTPAPVPDGSLNTPVVDQSALTNAANQANA